MRVTLSNRDITNGLVLAQIFLKRGLPVPLSFAIAKTIRKLRGITEVIAEERQRILDSHQKVDSEGKRILTKTGDVQLADPLAFNADFENLMKQVTEVDVHSIKLSTIRALKGSDGKDIEPSVEEMEGLLLLRMIDESEEETGE